MTDRTLILTKHEAVKRHVLGLNHKPHLGPSTNIPIAEIVIGERMIPEDAKVVAQLKTSIREVRQTTPILVRSLDWGYMLVDGLNRLAALKELGETEVSANVLDVTTEEEAKACEAISNRHRRQGLTALDRALSDFTFVKYVASKAPQVAAPRGGQQPKEKYYAKTARELGVPPDQIARSCKIARIVPQVQRAIRNRAQEDNQRLLLEVAASGDDYNAQVYTFTRLMNKVPETAEKALSHRARAPAHVDTKEREPVRSQSTSRDGGLTAPEASGGDARPSTGSGDEMPEATPGRIPNAAGEVQSRADPSGPKSPEDETFAEGSKQIQVNIDPALRAKLAKLADGAAIRLVGFVSAPLGLQPSIEVRGIAELSEGESD